MKGGRERSRRTRSCRDEERPRGGQGSRTETETETEEEGVDVLSVKKRLGDHHRRVLGGDGRCRCRG